MSTQKRAAPMSRSWRTCRRAGITGCTRGQEATQTATACARCRASRATAVSAVSERSDQFGAQSVQGGAEPDT